MIKCVIKSLGQTEVDKCNFRAIMDIAELYGEVEHSPMYGWIRWNIHIEYVNEEFIKEYL